MPHYHGLNNIAKRTKKQERKLNRGLIVIVSVGSIILGAGIALLFAVIFMRADDITPEALEPTVADTVNRPSKP